MTLAVRRSEPGTSGSRVRGAVDGRWTHESLSQRLSAARPLLMAWTRKEYTSRFRQSGLGLTWSVVQPLAMLLAYGLVLRGVLSVSSEGRPYISFAYAGLVVWAFFSNVLMQGTTCLLNTTGVLSKAYFPREVVPFAMVTVLSIDLLISTGLLVGIMVFQHLAIPLTFVALVPIYAILIVFAAGLSTFLSVIAVFVRDIRYAVPLLSQLLFIATPIMYSGRLFPESTRWVNDVNPIAVFVTGVREATVFGRWPDWPLLGAHALFAILLFCAGIAYVRSVEPRLADVA